jgi:transposase-like protein
LAAADRCSKNGEIGALLRREGIYSSHLATWRKQRETNERAGFEPKKRGRKADPAIAEARRVAELMRENERLRHKLAQAHTIIDVQKKLCTLLGLPGRRLEKILMGALNVLAPQIGLAPVRCLACQPIQSIGNPINPRRAWRPTIIQF